MENHLIPELENIVLSYCNPYKDAYDRVMNTINNMSKCRICYKPVKYNIDVVYLTRCYRCWNKSDRDMLYYCQNGYRMSKRQKKNRYF